MSSNSFGRCFKITTFGESHGEALGVVIDGCPAGLEISQEEIQWELDRRRPGTSEVTSPRGEKDQVKILSGVFEGKTIGSPIALIIENKDVKSSHYESIKDLFRPGHADYTYFKKYGHRDWRGGGRASARETAARVAAGAVAKKFLKTACGADIFAYTCEIFGIRGETFDRSLIENNLVRAADPIAAKKMEEAILKAKNEGNSVGGIVEVQALGIPLGLGEPVFDKLEADLAKALMSIPATKGFEMGDGFQAARNLGSQNNDPLAIDNKSGNPVFLSNHAGGTLGGISNGEPIVARVAIKATSSISLKQDTIDIHGKPAVIEVIGRHDPCVVPRAIPIVEAMTALVLADHFLRARLSRVFP